MTLTFQYHAIADPVHPAPRDREIMVFVPGRGKWSPGNWDDQRYSRKPLPYWRTRIALYVADDRGDQPVFWAELDAMRLGGEA